MMTKYIYYLYVAIIIVAHTLFASACSLTAKDHLGAETGSTGSPWRASYLLDHPLVGKIWDADKQAWISEKQFYLALNYFDYILLGEIHNHPDHHDLQAKAINSMVSMGRKPAVVMEMLSQSSWQDQPQNWQKQGELQELANMLNPGWPWDLYTPVLDSIVTHQLNLYAGNMNSKELHAWVKQQPEQDIQQAYQRYFYDEVNFSNLKNNIIDSHCGYANDELINFMSLAQMQRDYVITQSLLEKELPVVLIAGSGHVRNDFAVPMQLRRQHLLNSYLSIAYLPVQAGLEEPQDYPQVSQQMFDLIYFTPSHTLEDPCDKFKEQLQNMQQKHES